MSTSIAAGVVLHCFYFCGPYSNGKLLISLQTCIISIKLQENHIACESPIIIKGAC